MVAASSMSLFPDLEGHWLAVSDADPRAVALYSRHYSADRKRVSAWRSGIGGPGARIVLLTADCQALFLWRTRPEGLVKGHQGYDDGQRGVMCSVFRNEGSIRSSELIREADEIAWRRWPGLRHFTYVWDAKVATSAQRGRATAGWCYRKAGWAPCGRNADGRLTILEILPPTTDTRPARRPAVATEQAGPPCPAPVAPYPSSGEPGTPYEQEG